MLVCRCLIGQPHIVYDAGDHIAKAKSLKCDCVIGDREAKVGTYRECVFFDERQVIPEFAVIYRRQYDQDKVPSFLRRSTTGMTGKLWQVRRERWVNLSPDVSHELNELQNKGEKTLTRVIGESIFEFDIKS